MIWQMITLWTKVFIVFPVSIQISNGVEIITKHCNRESFTYVPARKLWLNEFILEFLAATKKSSHN